MAERLQRWVLALAGLALILCPCAAWAAKAKGKVATSQRAAPLTKAPTPAQPPVLADVALPPPVAVTMKARKTTELADLLKTRLSYDFDAAQMKLLTRYDLPADKRDAYAIDNDFYRLESPRFQHYLSAISDRLLRCWSGKRPPVHIIITSRAEYSAFAYDSGVIQISAGLLDNLSTTDEVAFALAHEIAHVLLEHGAKRDALAKTIEKGAGLLTSAIIIGRETQVNDQGGKLNFGVRSNFGSTGVLLSGYSLQSLSADAIVPLRGAKQEFEADRFAYDLVVCAGFRTTAAPSVIGMLGKAEIPNLDGLALAAQLAGQYLTGKVIQPKDDDDIGSQLLSFGTRLVVGTAFNAGVEGLRKKIEKSMGGAKRGAELEEYIGKFYEPIGVETFDQDNGYAQLKKDPYWRSIMEVTSQIGKFDERTRAAQIAAGPGKPIAVPSDLLTIIGAGFRPDPRVPRSYYVAGYAAAARSDEGGAGSAWEIGSRQSMAFRELLLLAGRSQYNRNDVAALRNTIDRGHQRIGNVPEMLQLDVRLAVLQKDSVQAEKTAARCLSKGGEGLYVRCVEPLGYDPVCAPRTEEAKPDIEAAKLERRANSLINLPGLAATLNAPAPKILSCLNTGGSTIAKANTGVLKSLVK